MNNMSCLYLFAPLDGITRAVYRRVWQKYFGGADQLYIPFFSPVSQHIMTKKDLLELEPVHNPSDVSLVPQVMTRTADDLIWAAEILRDMGYREINLNLGCPSGTVTAKGKGAGFLSEPDTLERFFSDVCKKICLPLSVKTRLGMFSPDEFPRILEIFNQYPLSRLILHPRTAKEKYRGPVHMDMFAYALSESRNPVCYNGNLCTVREIRDFAGKFPSETVKFPLETGKFPSASGEFQPDVMIGRGAVADPALFRKLRGGPAASRQELETFTAALYQAYQEFYGQSGSAAQRMREVWFYLIHLFDNNARLNKQMRRFRGPMEYEAAEAAIFRELPLREDVSGELI